MNHTNKPALCDCLYKYMDQFWPIFGKVCRCTLWCQVVPGHIKIQPKDFAGFIPQSFVFYCVRTIADEFWHIKIGLLFHGHCLGHIFFLATVLGVSGYWRFFFISFYYSTGDVPYFRSLNRPIFQVTPVDRRRFEGISTFHNWGYCIVPTSPVSLCLELD